MMIDPYKEARAIAEDLNRQWSAVLAMSMFGRGVLHLTYVVGSFTLGYLTASVDTSPATPLVGLFLLALVYALACVVSAHMTGITDILRQFRAIHEHAMVAQLHSRFDSNTTKPYLDLYTARGLAIEDVITSRLLDRPALIGSLMARYAVLFAPPIAGIILGAQ
jgi:hypothetical protein